MKRTLLIASICFLSLCLTTVASGAIVKMSKSKICHPPASAYYERISNYTSYSSVQACINAGGRLPKKMRSSNNSSSNSYKNSSSKKSIKSSTSGKYKRSYFGSGWADLDHDGQDSRQEALIAQSTSPVRLKRNRVASGRWISPFTNAVIHDPSKIDIDHVVPLKWAWIHGANTWTSKKRKNFANDPANLLSVEASLNRQKGAKGPTEWLPPANKCQYTLRFMRIVKKYNLQASSQLKSATTKACR